MARRGWRCICALFLAVSLAGCAGSTDQGAGPSPSAELSRGTKPVVLVEPQLLTFCLVPIHKPTVRN